MQTIQRSMQCFVKCSHYVHWSGFQIIRKEVLFHKNSHAQFPIWRMLWETSKFPREHVKRIEDSPLGFKSKVFTGIQYCIKSYVPAFVILHFLSKLYSYIKLCVAIAIWWMFSLITVFLFSLVKNSTTYTIILMECSYQYDTFSELLETSVN